MPTESAAALLAQRLAAFFLEHGNYVLAGPMVAPGAIPAGARPVEEEFIEELGFAGLAVQSVGYEVGTDEPRVHVYITKGRRAEKIAPTAEGDVDVQVHRVGRIIVRPELAGGATSRGNIYLRQTRVACGSSCAPSGEPITGTIGALVHKTGDTDLYMLSNNHVFAGCNHVPVGMPILAPSPPDSGPNRPAPRAVSEHAAICELRSGAPAFVLPIKEDVALATVRDPGLVSSWQGDQSGYDTPTTVMSPSSGLRVKKYGRTTGLTHGIIESYVPTPQAIPYKARHFTATVWFTEVWLVRAEPGPYFALPGDSGSLVVAHDGSAKVGLLFAASPNGDYGYIFPMAHIVTLFGGLSVVGAHGV